MHTSTDRLVWIDCEMTGLDLQADALVEIAVVISDFELQPIGRELEIIITPPAEALEQMNPVVRTMHTTSGLLDLLPTGTTLQQAEQELLSFLKDLLPPGAKAFLAGNSIGMDRAFLARDMPSVLELLHYRVIDVSTVKELLQHWHPSSAKAAPKKGGTHRALADITESLEELRFYRTYVHPPAGQGTGEHE